MKNSTRCVDAHEGKWLPVARCLFEEYAESLDVSLEFQQFANELASLPGDYSPPKGRLLVALCDEQPAGCVALRPIDDECCEMKRLFARPEFRGQRIGRSLAREIINKARKLGYSRMRLDTLPTMGRAKKLYLSLGFREIEAYRHNPVEGTAYMELSLE